MKNMYSFWAIFCLFTLFVISCSKDDETPAPAPSGTQTSTNQTGTSTKTTQTGTTTATTQTGTTTNTTQTGTTTNTTQTGTTTNTTQTAVVEVIVSGEVNGINLKVTDAPANQNPKTIANVPLKNADTKFEANKHIGKTLYFVLEKNGMPVSDVVEKEIRAGDNIVNLTVKKKKEDGKAAVNIKVTQDGKPVPNKKVYGVGGSLSFQSIINMIAFSGEQAAEYQSELKGITDKDGIVRFVFTPVDKNVTDYHFFIITEEEPHYLSVDVDLDGSLKEATIKIPKKVTASFVVTDSENEAVENATVSINNISLHTDNKGRVMIPLAMATYDYSVTLPCGTNKKGNITLTGDKTENVKFTTAERGQVIVENKTDKKCTVKFKGQSYELEAGATKVFMNLNVYNKIYDIDFYVNGNRVEKLYNGMLTCSQKKITFTLNPEDIK